MQYEYYYVETNEMLGDQQLEAMYQEMLGCDGDVVIGGMKFDPAGALKKLDPIAYQCGLNDYINGLLKDGVIGEIVEDRGDEYVGPCYPEYGE